MMQNKTHRLKIEKNKVIGLYDDYNITDNNYNCVIPSFYNGEEISIIGKWAFNSCYSFKNIKLSDSITDIEVEAFYFCGELKHIEFGSNLKHIGDYAFLECTKLKSVTLPSSLISIGVEAFMNCYALTSVTLGKNLSVIGLNAFSNCKKLKNIYVSKENEYFSSKNGILYNKEGTEIVIYPPGRRDREFIIPNGVTSIGRGCFSTNEYLERIIVPSSVSRIGESAFSECSINSISLHDNLESIEKDTIRVYLN